MRSCSVCFYIYEVNQTLPGNVSCYPKSLWPTHQGSVDESVHLATVAGRSGVDFYQEKE